MAHPRPTGHARRGLGAFGLCGLAALAGRNTTAPGAAEHAPVFMLSWERVVDPAAPIALSSPAPAELEGIPAAVVGDQRGLLHALSLRSGTELSGWPVEVGGGAPIESSPSVAGTTVFVGAGSAAKPDAGGYYAFSAEGRPLWATRVRYLPHDRVTRGVVAGLAVGTLEGTTAVVAGSLGQYLEGLNARTGRPLPGFPWFQADTVFSTAAIADLYGNGATEIVEGGDSTAGTSFGVRYANGGHVRVLAASGNAGAPTPSGGLACEYNTDQVVQSSPAVGPFLAGAATGIVVGTGTHYPGARSSDVVLALTSHCRLAWSRRLDGATTDSPALVDALGTGHLEVAEGTASGSGGSVYLLDGATGRVLWHRRALAAVIGGITSVPLGTGYQDLVVPTLHGVEVLDGRSGAVLRVLETVVGVQNSPLVTDDPDGRIGITIAGYKAGGTSAAGEAVVEHFSVPGSDGSLVTASGAWPEFHHDPRLSGDA